jgi:hypothetical protein
MSRRDADDLRTIELLVLQEAGGDNTLGDAYGAVQLHSVFESRERLLEVTQSALLKLFDWGFVRFVEAPVDAGYTAKRFELPALTREELLVAFEEDCDDSARQTDTDVWLDPTPEGQAMLHAVPSDRIPRVSGVVKRPWPD